MFSRPASPSRRPAWRQTAFTLVEVLVSLSLVGVLGGIIYALAIEAVTSFARNVSLNKSYTDARMSFARVGNALQSCGQIPTPLGKDGTTTNAGVGPFYYGVRFYRYGAVPTYTVPTTITATATTLAIRGTGGQEPPLPGDLVVVPGIGFQAAIQAGGVTGTAPDWTVSFATNVTANCATAPAAADLTAATTCLLYRQVAFVVADNPVAGGPMQLRYYPKADAPFAATTSYRVLANLAPAAAAVPTDPAVAAAQGGKIFRRVSAAVAGTTSNTSLLQITLCAELPDYDKRALGTNNYTQMQTTLGSRCPLSLTGTL